MQNNIDYQEIVQTVAQIVMTDISNKLNSMKPDFEQKIINALNGAIDSRLANLENRLNNTQSRLTENWNKSCPELLKIQFRLHPNSHRLPHRPIVSC